MTAQVADELLPALDEDAPRVDVPPASLAPRRSRLAKVDDRYRFFFGSQRSERLDDHAERQLRRNCQVVRCRQAVGGHAEEARVAVACGSNRDVEISPLFVGAWPRTR